MSFNSELYVRCVYVCDNSDVLKSMKFVFSKRLDFTFLFGLFQIRMCKFCIKVLFLFVCEYVWELKNVHNVCLHECVGVCVF